MADTADKVVKIKVIGVGGAGNNVINRMIASDVKGVEFVAVNTDKQDLEKSKCKNKVQIGEKLTGGMGAGAKPDIGKKSAEEIQRRSSSRCSRARTWSSSPPVWAAAPAPAQHPSSRRSAHDAGILTVGVVTKPFRFEGANRMKQAEAGIANLTDKVDSHDHHPERPPEVRHRPEDHLRQRIRHCGRCSEAGRELPSPSSSATARTSSSTSTLPTFPPSCATQGRPIWASVPPPAADKARAGCAGRCLQPAA